jgi:phosphatidylglycerophosphatase A
MNTRSLSRLIASGCGCGFAPLAPGTVASVAALVPGTVLLNVAPALLPVAVLLAVLVGLWAIHSACIDGDPGWVVIDEIAGQLLTLCGLSRVSLLGVLASFAIFRLLDIAKPGPIGWAERQKGASAIIADDVIAGAIGAGIVWAIGSRWPELFR